MKKKIECEKCSVNVVTVTKTTKIHNSIQVLAPRSYLKVLSQSYIKALTPENAVM